MSITKALFSFTGRMPRGIFLFVVAWTFATGLALFYIAAALNEFAVLFCLWILWTPLQIWVLCAAQAKRWHDRNKSAWMLLVNLIPVAGWIWSFVELGLLRGISGPNRYGEDMLAKIGQPAGNVA